MEMTTSHLCYNCFQEIPEGGAPAPTVGLTLRRIRRITPRHFRRGQY